MSIQLSGSVIPALNTRETTCQKTITQKYARISWTAVKRASNQYVFPYNLKASSLS